MQLKPWHVIAFLVAVSTALVAAGLPAGTRLEMAAASLASGVCALALMAGTALLGARLKFVESAFGGLDRVYVAHKWMGIWALGLASFHLLFKAGMPEWDTAAILTLPGGWTRFVRQFAFVGLMFIVLLALNRNIPYGTWRWWHKLSGPLFVVVVLHWLSFKQPFALASPAGMWLAALSALGVAGAFYKLLLYPLWSANAEYRVVQVDRGGAAMHLQLEPVNKGIDFWPGQFGFLRMLEQGLREPHPFTIASGSGGTGRVGFVIRELGDFTRKLITEAQPGMRAEIYAPFGRFARRPEALREVWIAGGVGITPFIAWLQDVDASGFDKVTLFYCYTTGREFPAADVIENLARERGATPVRVAGGPSDAALVEGLDTLVRESDPRNIDVAFCGPPGLLAQVRRQLRAHGVPDANLRYEVFQFR